MKSSWYRAACARLPTKKVVLRDTRRIRRVWRAWKVVVQRTATVMGRSMTVRSKLDAGTAGRRRRRTTALPPPTCMMAVGSAAAGESTNRGAACRQKEVAISPSSTGGAGGAPHRTPVDRSSNYDLFICWRRGRGVVVVFV